MNLGLNLPYPYEWSRARLFRNALHQMEPWWVGDWNSRRYLRQPMIGTARSVLGPNMIPGLYIGNDAIYLRGDCRSAGLYEKANIGPGNVWLEKSGGSPDERLEHLAHESDWQGSQSGDSLKPGLFRDDVVESITKAGTIRLMDWCAPGSGLRSIDQLQRSGESARAIPLESTTDGLHAECGLRPEFIHEVAKHAKRIWLNPPLHICLNPNEFIRWCEKFIPSDCEVFISPANELWNLDLRFPASHMVFNLSRITYPNDDTYARMATLVLKLCIQMKQLLASLSPRVTVVFEWWNAHVWGLQQYDNEALLREVGELATAPYMGHGATDAGSLQDSVIGPLANLRRMKDLAESCNARTHIYEMGGELPASSRLHLDPEYPEIVRAYVAESLDIIDPNGVACWYETERPGGPAWNDVQRYTVTT